MKLGNIHKGQLPKNRFSDFENLVRSVKTGSKRRPMGQHRKVSNEDLIDQELQEMAWDGFSEPNEGV